MSDELLFALPPSPQGGPPLAGAESEVMKRAGCGPECFEIARAFAGKARAKIVEFLADYTKHGPQTLALMRRRAERVKRRGWPLPIGADTLRGVLRFGVRGFTLCNDFAPFYVAALAEICPELRGILERKAALPQTLIRLGWKPSLDGGPRHD